MTRTAATLLMGAGFMLAFAPSACTPNEDAGECDSSRPCSERGEVCDTLEKVCIEADVDVDATAESPATGNFGPLALPFFRGKVCIAEVEEIVPTGSLDPDTIHLPGIYVHRIVQGDHEKRIERRTVRKG